MPRYERPLRSIIRQFIPTSYFRSNRHFPPPWTVEEYRGISYIIRDANKFAVAYVYFASEAGRRAAANLMTKDEARKIAAGIANCRSCCENHKRG